MRQDRRNFGQRNFAPVKVGEELDVKIEAVGEKGDGIAKKDGFVLFVPSTKQGDNVRIKVTRVLQKVGFAEVVGQAQASESPEESQEQESGSKENYEESSEGQESEENFEGEDSDDFGEEEQQ